MRAAAARVALALAYPLLAHWATHDGGGWAAAVALTDLTLVVLIDPLLQARAWAWAVFALAGGGLYALAATPWPQLLLLAPPVLFLAMLAWFFGRTLREPREALITRIVMAVHGHTPADMPAPLRRYTRTLTLAWTVLLATLATVNGVLALVAVPDGVLARLGHAPAWGVPREHWSLIANLLNYGVVGGFFAFEYVVRRRYVTERPYRNFVEFLQLLGRLGPGFWRSLFR